MDSVMLARDMFQNNDELRMVGRDIKSVFNVLRRGIITEILKKYTPLQQWVAEFLRPGAIDVYLDGKLAHTATMIEGTPQGSPLSLSLFSIYASEMVWQAQRGLQQQLQQGRAGLRLRKMQAVVQVLPLSYIDDINALVPRTTSTKTWHKHLNEAAVSVMLKWDEEKDWDANDSPHLGVYIGNVRRHWKERLKMARGMWEYIRRLTRLPPVAKRTIVCEQLIRILYYGCEVFEEPNE